MDSLITAAAHSLAHGDPLAALRLVALRADPPALALRGIAMAQLGDFPRAKLLLRQAFLAFSPRESLSRARCLVAQAEVALASRDLAFPAKTLHDAALALSRHGDHANAAYARFLQVRRLLLLGRLSEAEQNLAAWDPAALPPAHRANYELLLARLSLRRLRASAARESLQNALSFARRAAIPALTAEIESEMQLLSAPAACLVTRSGRQTLSLEEVESLLSAGTCLIDACRSQVHGQGLSIPLASRPVLFALARALAETWPGECTRAALIAAAFGSRLVNESHRARLRVEMGRLRKALRPIAAMQATKQGFALVPVGASSVSVLAPLVEERHTALLALLADGESWSSSALAAVLGTSQRSVQRALEALAAGGRIQPVGRGRGRRWAAPVLPQSATALLLPLPLLLP
ncbi:MAG TPA: helix-turn-helix domain-containing protein [Bryobacteraceae bacterium]|nr:helix-turn-helix domain-containing protein [Bryobacteraceae bacterium]